MSKQNRYPSEMMDSLNVRLPDGLRQKIKVAAAENERTMSAEVVYHLKRAYEAPRNEKSGTTA